MSKPSNRQGLIDYCLRQLGAPVLEINIADEDLDWTPADKTELLHASMLAGRKSS